MKKGKPYIKRYKKIRSFTVWIVDGSYIRRVVDKEFTNFGQHYRFNFIPENEFWIDKEYGRGDEKEYFITHMLLESRLMQRGVDYVDAITISSRAEAAERAKSEISQIITEIEKDRQKLLDKIHWKFLKNYSGKLDFWVVDGEVVRNTYYIDFTQGGHSKVYAFVPEGEIWIDDDVGPRERKYIILHELHEYNLMVAGKDYNSAHESASRLEWRCRRDDKLLKKSLKKEFKKIKI